ncbi:MAG: hypothetical protein ACYTBV_17235, partial [Planctomycetota bacterium]
MFKLSRKYSMGVFVILAFTLFSTSSIALFITRNEGIWPANWPKELEPYRNQAKTIELAAGNQENVYEIHFESREEFEKLWPTILKLKDKGAPIRLRSIEKPFKKGGLFNNEEPAVRIFSYVCPAWPSSGPDGKKLIPAPPWPESIKFPRGELPEYVTRSKDGSTWIPVGGKKPRGFMFRARTEVELVVDGTIIDLNRIYLPSDTPILDNRKLDKQPAVQVEGEAVGEKDVFIATKDSHLSRTGVNIYLLEDEHMNLKTARTKLISQLVLRKEPWIASEDIQRYDVSSHCIYLKKNISIP